MPTPELAERLSRMTQDRQTALDKTVAAARRANLGALLLIGSLGRGGGDAWSDLDLIAVGDPEATLDLAVVFGDQVLATVDAPREAPIGGSYAGVCLQIADGVLWLDWYRWPIETAAIPTDATALYDDLRLPASPVEFIPLITAHSDPTAPGASGDAAVLLRVAVAAKYLARSAATKLAAKIPETAGLRLDEMAERLHAMAASVTDPKLAAAVTATRRLVDLAEAAQTSS
ncbi:hypothetical protein AB0M47_02075 [Hamadaea sp. NPDC051192]|uniref:hypothetical protein n=1 Tax=Hamadaea sp. NPDC051192 TaxID=3154940 RepID=UPI0034374F3C